VRLVELSIGALITAGERASLAAIARASKTIDPSDTDGISASAILHNEEAYALYQQHAARTRQARRKPSPRRHTNGADDNRMRVRADRDPGRARQRYLRATKLELVNRLLEAEKAYADMENRWLRTADDLLAWIMLFDRLIAASRITASSH
jgi:hypothetical protein